MVKVTERGKNYWCMCSSNYGKKYKQYILESLFKRIALLVFFVAVVVVVSDVVLVDVVGVGSDSYKVNKHLMKIRN